jgi:SET domain
LTLANHDCHPNASIEFLQESNRGSMVALRDIAEQEEICITYVPNGGWGTRDGAEFFRHFVPTRTWKWLNQNSGGANNEEEDESSGSECGDDDDDGDEQEGGAENEESGQEEEERFNEEEPDGEAEVLEGSDPYERAKALTEYGFECQCKRCLEERTSNGQK